MVAEAVMAETRVAIAGVGKCVPERVVGNRELAEVLSVDPAWIESRTGIRERRYAAVGESASDLAIPAAVQALHRSGRSAAEVGHVIVATCTPDYLFPPTACIVQRELGATGVAAFDVNAACSGFLAALSVGASLLAGTGKVAVVVGVDLLSRHVDVTDPRTACLFGDGAAAVVLERDETAPPSRFELYSDGSGEKQVYIPGGGSRRPNLFDDGAERTDCIKMAGREVYRNAVRRMTEVGADFGASDFDLVIPHQANRRILDECAVLLGLSPDRLFSNIDRYGNTSAASIPLATCEAWESGRLTPGDRLLLLSFGAGLTWGGAALPWTLPVPAEDDSSVDGSGRLAEVVV